MLAGRAPGAGTPARRSRAGTVTCASMMAATPASAAAWKGGSSTCCRRGRSCARVGSSRCESLEVSPCPGKCFAHAATPWRCISRMSEHPMAATTSGDLLNDRDPMTGLSGLVSTSITGAASRSMFTARNSRPRIFPAEAAATSGLEASLRTRAAGILLNGGPKRATRPPSWSIIINSGLSAASSLRLAQSSATCFGFSMLRANRMTPPKPLSINRRACAAGSVPFPSNPKTNSFAASLSMSASDSLTGVGALFSTPFVSLSSSSISRCMMSTRSACCSL
mmetsp:Transcript_24432/g.53334  ORF Transcript_24432/g.53334 Transcript_24432/m.53334 type:complete len:280 (+) Transcript_24432:672-1511(+)